MIFLQLFWEFFKIGLFAMGGGPATLPFLMELADKYDWYALEDLTDMVAVSESTPGPLGVNMATYAGYRAAGILGGLIATLALVLPSVIIIILIAKFLTDFSQRPVVKAVFLAVRPAVTALIAAAIWGLFQVVLVTENGALAVKPLILCGAVFVLMRIKPLKKLHPAVWLLAAAVTGIVFRF